MDNDITLETTQEMLALPDTELLRMLKIDNEREGMRMCLGIMALCFHDFLPELNAINTNLTEVIERISAYYNHFGM